MVNSKGEGLPPTTADPGRAGSPISGQRSDARGSAQSEAALEAQLGLSLPVARQIALQYAIRRTSDWQLAEDLCQIVFAKLLARAQLSDLNLSPGGGPAYIVTCVKRASASHWTAENSMKRGGGLGTVPIGDSLIASNLAAPWREGPEAQAIGAQLHAAITEIVRELPKKQRDVMVLVLAGKSRKQIARKLTISVEAVRDRQNGALRTIRRMLVDAGWVEK